MEKYPTTRVCKALGISRSNQYQNRKPRPKRYRRKDDELVLQEIRAVAKEKSTYGYRRTAGILRRKRREKDQRPYNPKRIYRLMAMNDLLISRSLEKTERIHNGKIITMRSDLRYCSDIFEIHCWNGEEVHVAFSLDCCDREQMAFVARPHDLTRHEIMELMDKTAVHRFGPLVERLPHPIEWLTDNGGQYTACDTKAYGKEWGFLVRNTPAYSPESNGMSEAFIKTFKRDYVYTHELPDAETVINQLPAWFEDYNEKAPHSGLKYLSPREYRRKQAAEARKSLPEFDMSDDLNRSQPPAWDHFEKKTGNQDDPELQKTVSV
jgi:putative transposase